MGKIFGKRIIVGVVFALVMVLAGGLVGCIKVPPERRTDEREALRERADDENRELERRTDKKEKETRRD
jgi:hypothetical protein